MTRVESSEEHRMMSATQDDWINVEHGDEVLEFAYSYLQAHSRPPSDDEVHNVTAAIARYKGPALIRAATLELFVAPLLASG
jgi:hypothetical protein